MSEKREMNTVLTTRVHDSTAEEFRVYHENTDGSKAQNVRRLLKQGLALKESGKDVDGWRREVEALEKDKTRLKDRIADLEADLDAAREERVTVKMERAAGDIIMFGVALFASAIAFASEIAELPIISLAAVAVASVACIGLGFGLRINFVVGDPFGRVVHALQSVAGQRSEE